MGLEMCINNKCVDNDTVIVLLYAMFCVVFGLVTAMLVRLADRMKGERGEPEPGQGNAEVRLISERNVFMMTICGP